MNSLFMFPRILSLYQIRYTASSISSSPSSSSKEIYPRMKKLMDSKEYTKVLDLFNQQSHLCKDIEINIALRACISLNDYQSGMNIQQKLSQNSLNNSYIQTSLIRLYMQCNNIDNACHLFSKIINKTNYIYTTMFKGLILNNMPEKVLDLSDEMKIEPNQPTLAVLFSACARLANDRAIKTGKKALDEMPKNFLNDDILLNSAINMLMRFSDVSSAENLFQMIKKKNIITYSAMMKGYVRNNICDKALDLFEQIPFNLNDVSYAIIFNACAQLSNDRAKQIGKKLLDEIPIHFLNDNVLVTSAIDMSMRFGDVKSAENLFEMIKKKDIITYGAMMQGYLQNNMYDKTLDLFEQIPFNLNDVIYIIIFNACAQLANDRAIEIGRKLLNQMPKNYEQNIYIQNSAINMLIGFGDVKNAEHFFQMIKKKDIITYVAMMKGYLQNNMCDKILDLFEQLNSNLNDVIYAIVFNACAQLSNDRAMKIGIELLNQMSKNYEQNMCIQNSAINMLIRFGDVKSAENLFETIQKKNIITYGTMMNGYNRNNEPLKTLKLLEEMKQLDINLDVIISTISINACAQIGMRSRCQLIVAQIPSHFYKDLRMCNSLIDMWGKAGLVKNAQEIFESIHQPNVFTYTAMINSYGRNHMGLEAVDLYRKMPMNLHNEISSICVLNACSHSGLLNQAYSIFNEISHKTEQVITTMVDCLSRLFLFDEAQMLIEDHEKFNPPCSSMYMAILSGARNSRRSVLSKNIYQRMKLLFPDEKNILISGSILLGNIYSSLGDHEEAQDIRFNRIKDLGKKVQPGLAWTEVKGEIVQFKALDHSHPRSKEIYAEAARISSELIKYGYDYDSSWITRPLHENETIESVLCAHSERLAIAFNFIQETKPSFIQITKNLRVCGDCHQATKLIAKIRQVEIVVRDANCIHHFSTNGTCSCQDHF